MKTNLYRQFGLALLVTIATQQVQSQSWSLTGNSGTTTSNFIGTKDNVDFRIRTNNSTRVTINGSGYAGFGVTPESELRLCSNYPRPTFTSQSTIYAAVRGRYTDNTIGVGPHANGYLGAYYNSGSAIIGGFPGSLNYAGVLGIKEDGNDFGAGVVGWNKNTNTSGTHYGVYGIANGNHSGFSNVNDKNIGIYGSAFGNYSNIGLYGYATGTNDWAAYLKGRTYLSDKVGIGTESPTSMLTVNAPANASPFKLMVSSAVKMIVNSAGNVGIGTGTPSIKLHVKGTGELLRLDAASPSLTLHNNGVEKAYLQCNSGNFNIGTSSGNTAGNLYFYLNGSPRMTVLNNGNVGIGTVSPNAKLSINGNGAAIDLIGTNNFIQFYTSGNVAKSYIQNSGNNLSLGTSTGNSTGHVSLNTAGGSLTMNQNGDVMINTSTPATGYKLSVNGKVICEELKVQVSGSWPDYVFADKYDLRSIEALESFILKNRHLPGMPAATEVEKNGLSMGAMQTLMMEKIEELTLYVIQLKKQNDELTSRINN